MANKFKFTVEGLKDKLDNNGFDAWLKANNYPYKTVTRLAQYLGTNRQTLCNYRNEIQSTLGEEDRHNILLALSRAMADIEACGEDRLYDKNMANGAKFSMAANYGWSDRQTLDIGGDGLKVELSPELQDWAK